MSELRFLEDVPETGAVRDLLSGFALPAGSTGSGPTRSGPTGSGPTGSGPTGSGVEAARALPAGGRQLGHVLRSINWANAEAFEPPPDPRQVVEGGASESPGGTYEPARGSWTLREWFGACNWRNAEQAPPRPRRASEGGGGSASAASEAASEAATERAVGNFFDGFNW